MFLENNTEKGKVMRGKTFLHQVNVTRDCNIRCTHCYISTDKKVASKYMTKEQFLEIISQIRDHMVSDAAGPQEYGHAEIHVIGGEPCMLGLAFFEDVMPKAKALLADVEQEVTLKIVTNLLAADTIEIVKMFDFVTTSFEYETRFPKQKLLEKWENRCREISSTTDVDFGVTTSVTNQVIKQGAEKLLNYFLDLGIRQVHLGFFIPAGDGLINQKLIFPPFEKTSDYLIDTAEWYWKNRDKYPDLYVNPAESLLLSIHNNEPADDLVCPIIPGSLDFDWDGNTVTCIEAGGEIEVDWIANVFEIPVVDILKSPKYLREKYRAISPKRICASCDELPVCQSACGVLHKTWDGTGECPGFKKFIKYVRMCHEERGILPRQAIEAAKFMKG